MELDLEPAMCALDDEERGAMQISLVGISGEVEASFILQHHATLRDLKEMVAEQVGVTPMQQRLLHGSTLLRARGGLAAAGVHDQSQVTLVKLPRPVVAIAEEWSVALWDVNAAQVLHHCDGHDGDVSSLCFSADGTQLLTSSFDGTLKIWSVESGNCLKTFAAHSDTIRSAIFSRDATKVLTTSVDNVARLWDAALESCIQAFEGHTEGVWCAAFSSDESLIATGSTDCTVRIWATSTGACLGTLESHEDRVRVVQFSPDDALLLSACEGGICRLWSVATWTPRQALGHPGERVLSAAFASDGLRVVTATNVGTARVFDVETGSLLLELLSTRPCDLGESSVAFSSDDSRILHCSGQGVLLWDTESQGSVVLATPMVEARCAALSQR